jgi:Membrane bound beta barrel domain (DUF5777)
MTLLLLLLTFPGQRIANLPTGVLPESHVWQLNISHRFVPAILASGWTNDPLQLFNGANVRDVLDKSLGDRALVGVNLTITTREMGLHGAWAPLDWLTLYPELNTHLYGFKRDSTWFNLGLCCHRTFGKRWAVAAQPRYTTNTGEHFVSLGLGAKAQVINTWSLGLEAEPVLLGRDSTTRNLAWTLALEKEYGWHNFVFTFGSPLDQSAPGMFRSTPGDTSAYSGLLDLAQGYFRMGFNIMRKI